MDSVKSAIAFLVKSVEKKKKNLGRDGHHLMQFLQEEFNFPIKKGSADQSISPSFSVDAEPGMSLGERSFSTPSPKKLKTDCGKCVKSRVAMASLITVNRKRKRQIDEIYISSATRRSLRQALEHKTKIEMELRIARRKLIKTLREKDRAIKRLKKDLGFVIVSPNPRKKCKCRHKGNLAIVEKQRNAFKKRCNQLELENESLRAALIEEDEAHVVSVKKDAKTYSSNYRKAAYACILHQVPVTETSSVIAEVVEEMTGLQLESEANATTVAQFAYEVGILNDIQVCEAIMANENLTIAWDATSPPSAEHINEVHLMFPGDPPWGLELQVNSLAGGKTEGYVSHITEALYDVSDSYALFSGKSTVEVRDTVVSKLKNTISDRVVVNHWYLAAAAGGPQH